MTDAGVLLFIDAIEDDEVWVVLGEARHRMPRALLPPGAREGNWLRLGVDAAQERKVAEELQARREGLGPAAPKGNLKL
jgi:hypothetical protein